MLFPSISLFVEDYTTPRSVSNTNRVKIEKIKGIEKFFGIIVVWVAVRILHL